MRSCLPCLPHVLSLGRPVPTSADSAMTQTEPPPALIRSMRGNRGAQGQTFASQQNARKLMDAHFRPGKVTDGFSQQVASEVAWEDG